MGLNVNGGVDYPLLVNMVKDLRSNDRAKENWLMAVSDTQTENYKGMYQISMERADIIKRIDHFIEVHNEHG